MVKRVSLKLEVLIFTGLFIIISAFILIYSPIVHLIFTHDTSSFLDGAWRIENGQLPHVDFSSILGGGFLYQEYLFLKLFNYDLIAIAVSSVVLTSLLMVLYLSFYKSKTFIAHSSPVLRLYIFFLLIALGLGQYCFGWNFTELTYACIYNRYCYECLLLIILMLILLNGKNHITKKTVSLLVIISLLVNYLLFVKITFFLVAAAILFLFLLIGYISFNYFKFLLLISLAVFFAILLLSGENFFSILNDYKSISSVRTGLFTTREYLLEKFNHPFNIILLLSYVALIVQLIRVKAIYKTYLLLLFVGVMSILLHLTNFGYRDLVFLTFIPCLFMLPDFVSYRKLLSFKILLFCCCYFFCKNLCSIVLMPSSDTHKHTELKNSYIKNFKMSFIIPQCKIDYAERQEEGVKIINKNIQSREKVMSYTYENMFPLLTHTVPPKNDLIVWQDGMTYSKNHYPNPTHLFSDVNLLLIPKCDEWEASLVMKKIYATTLKDQFLKIDESANWTLYRKK